jgi:hypothetical protein
MIIVAYAGSNLNLLGTPALIRFAHVGRWLNGGNELEGDVSESDEGDQRTINDAQHVIM